MTNSLKNRKVSQVLKMPNSKDNFGLTKHEFDQFVKKVKDGDESLFIQVFNIHFKASVHYVQNKFNISYESAYDVCMDTLIEFRSKLKSGKISYGNIRFLYTKMAVHKYLDELKRKHQINEAIKIFIGGRRNFSITNSEFFMLLNAAIERLDDAQKHLIRDIFYSGKEVEQIMSEHQISNSTFRKRKQRSLEKLKYTFLELLKKRK